MAWLFWIRAGCIESYISDDVDLETPSRPVDEENALRTGTPSTPPRAGWRCPGCQRACQEYIAAMNHWNLDEGKTDLLLL